MAGKVFQLHLKLKKLEEEVKKIEQLKKALIKKGTVQEADVTAEKADFVL
jgi:hypothetical protein